MNRQQTCSLLGRFLVVAAVVACLKCGNLRADESPALNLKHLPAEAVGAAFAFPQKLMAMPELELAPTEIIQAAGIKEFGFDPLTIEQALVFVAAPTGPMPPEFGAILHCNKPVKPSDKLLSKMTAKNHEGQEYFTSEDRRNPTFCIVNETTLLVANEPMLLKMITADGVDSPLSKLLSETETTNDFTAVISIDPLRELIKQAMSQLPPLPPPFQPLLNVPDQTESIKLKINYSKNADGSNKFTGLQLRGVSEEAAEQLQSILYQAVEIGRQMFLGQMMQEQAKSGNANDPVQQATQQYMVRYSKAIAKLLHPKLDGDVVSLGAEGEMSSSVATSAVLVSLLLPAVQSARTAARRTQSKNNMKQILLGFHNHHDVFLHFPARANGTTEKPLLSWRVHILPWIDQAALYEKFHLDEPWDSPHNKELIKEMPATYLNPLYGPIDGFKTTYLAPIGENLMFSKEIVTTNAKSPRGARMREITDGTSNTIMLIESNKESAVIWTRPDDLEIDEDDPLANVCDGSPGTFSVGWADGAVTSLTHEMAIEQFNAMLTRNGGEIVRRP